MYLKNRTDSYLQYGFKINNEEIALLQEVLDWIPSEILDFHTHVMPAKCIRPLSENWDRYMGSTFLYADAEIHYRLREMFFSDKVMRQVAFAFPFPGFDFASANNYLAELSEHDQSFIPFWTGTADDLKLYQKDMEHFHFHGVKLYPIPGDKTLGRSYPDLMLNELNKSGLPLVMHLPSFLSSQINDVESVVQRFPQLCLILAHMGTDRIYSDDLLAAYETLSRYENVYVDTSAVDDVKIFRAALETFGSERMLFATDQPFNLLRVQPVIHPVLGQRYATDFNYHWADPDEQLYYHINHSLVFVYSGLKMVIALRRAVEDVFGDSKEIKARIFSKNAQKLLF
ncbi:MAG: amidohydrolase [Patescibacteria group bacterium]|nr:amidohydrolase [Patescibacteria group bacterium]